jgi:threonine dehydratase
VITLADIEAAAGRLAGQTVLTPLLESPLLNDRLGRRLLVKPECLQRTGSFKFRGAFNRLSQLDADQRKRGVIAFSSGNHAQGVAYAARLLGMASVIVMPADAPGPKIAATRAYGAEVVLYNRQTESREEISAGIARERGLVLVPPFDDWFIITGQGTVGLEIAQQCKALEITPDAIAANCSGGGLSAGISVAASALLPGTAVYTAEPADFDDTRRSLEAGRRTAAPAGGKSFCDALLSPLPGELTFSVLREKARGGVTATDAEVEVAMATAAAHFKIVAEPGGSVALAAALLGRIPGTGPVIAVVSGGNVEPALFRAILERNQPL